MRLVIFLLTLFFGKKAGKDQFGNVYYYSNSKLFAKQKRWVYYMGSKEASKIPDYWEAWLRFMLDKPIDTSNKHLWQQDHLPNLTGTNHMLDHKDNILTNFNSYKAWKEK